LWFLIALPQLSATLSGDRTEMPKVSPGQTFRFPNCLETRMAGASHPRVNQEGAENIAGYAHRHRANRPGVHDRLVK
jgi:hypothetical protein